MLLKVADLYAHDHDFPAAIAIYEKIVTASLDSPLMRHSARDHLFKASLCQLVIGAKKDNMEAVSDKIDSYKDMHPSFENSKECKLIMACIEAFEDNNVDLFTEKV